MTTDPNEAAFPTLYPDGTEYGGLTKREYFAAMALQGLLAANRPEDFDPPAKEAVYFAGALIAALNEVTP